nr:helix-turn-helix domain-containing protein [Devosia oryzisoli]
MTDGEVRVRAPIGFRISNRRKVLRISQAALARMVGISASYLNLIENNKRDIGGALLQRVAQNLGIDVGELTGEAEQKLLQDLEEAYADPLVESLDFQPDERRHLVAQYPASAAALARLHRAYASATANADAYADRLRSDPLLGQLLHQILSGVTAVRSSAEILEDVPDLADEEQRQFIGAITRETRGLTDVIRTLIGQFEVSSKARRSGSTAREIDDFIIESANYFPALEEAASRLRNTILSCGPFGIASLEVALGEGFGVTTVVGERPQGADPHYAGQYQFLPDTRILWFSGATTNATRQFQLARLFAELSVPELIAQQLQGQGFTATAERLALRALGTYLAGAIVLPYDAFLEDAERSGYDLDFLRQRFSASYEQVAHRLVTLRRPGREGVPFGFLRSDPAGRLTKHFPLPGLLLPNSGHACPLWAIYAAFRTPDMVTRQVVRFSDGSRYLFIARTVNRRSAGFSDLPLTSSIMLACNVLHADRTIYARGLDLNDTTLDVPVGPSCRLCPRTDCPSRQEEALAPVAGQPTMRAPLVPTGFSLGEQE